MNDLTCPKCRQSIADAALDAGQCPRCGFPLDGPVVLGAARRTPVLALAAVGVLVAAGLAGGYAIYAAGETTSDDPAPEVAALEPGEQPPEEVHVAPFPHEPKRAETQDEPRPQDNGPAKSPAPKPEPVAPPVPVVVEPPKRDGPRPIPVVMKIDPRIQPKRHFDQPDDIAALPDLNSGDRVTITGRLRALRIGSVNGQATLDASGLVAEEIVISGDLTSDAVVKLSAPGGTVTIGGHVAGASRLTVIAPGGRVVVRAEGGRLFGTSVTTVTAKRLDFLGKMRGSARLSVTLTAGGSLKLTLTEEGATVTYRRAAPADPPLKVEKGVVRGGARVIAE
jgi:hypothetical protein